MIITSQQPELEPQVGFCARCHDNAVAEWSEEMQAWVSPCCAEPVLVGGEA